MACDPNTLIDSARCFNCLTADQLAVSGLPLLCDIARYKNPQNISGAAHRWRASSLNLANNAPVGAAGVEWRDSIGGLLASQSTAASRPTYVVNGIGGRPAVHYTGSAPGTQQFLTLNSSFLLTGEFTVIAVVRVMIHSSIIFPFLTNTAITNFLQMFVNGSFQYFPNATFSGGAVGFSTFGVNVAESSHVLFFRRNAASLLTAGYNNSQSQSLASSGTITVNRLGQTNPGFGNTTTVRMAELLHYTRGLTDVELATLYKVYLKPRYALP